MAKNYIQGKYTVKNKSKYLGDANNVVFRSSWEKKLFIYLDNNPDVINWGSEELVINYVSPSDNRVHRYFPDVIMTYKDKLGVIKKAVIEVKPYKQTQPPQGKRMTKFLAEEYKTYAVNLAKWKYAKEWCEDNGAEFMIMTERELKV